MAKIQCNNCGSYVDSKKDVCPKCGGYIDRFSNGSTISPHGTHVITGKPAKAALIIIFIFFFIGPLLTFAIPILMMMGLMQYADADLTNSYCFNKAGEICYFEEYDTQKDGSDMWKYDKEKKEWFLYATVNDDETPPDGINLKTKPLHLLDVVKETNLKQEEIDIYNSKAFIDDNGPLVKEGYYYFNNTAYYVLPETKNIDSNTQITYSKAGWFIYQNNQWEYFCETKDKTKLDNELWYNANDYYKGFNYNDINTDNSISISDFKNTTYYKEHEGIVIYENSTKHN